MLNFYESLILIVSTVVAYASSSEDHVNPYPYHFVVEPVPCTTEKVAVIVHSAVGVSQ